MPNCPQCSKPLEKVRYPGGMLNEYQWDSVRAGDWLCETCPSNGRSNSPGAYFWNKEVEGKPDSEPKPAESTHFRGSYLCRNCGLQHKYHGQWGECPTEAPSEAVERVQPEPATTNQAYNGNPLYKPEPANVEPQPTHDWRELYDKLPAERRAKIEVQVMKDLAEMNLIDRCTYESVAWRCVKQQGHKDGHSPFLEDGECSVEPQVEPSRDYVALDCISCHTRHPVDALRCMKCGCMSFDKVAADSVSHPPLEQVAAPSGESLEQQIKEDFWEWCFKNAVNGALRVDEKWRIDDIVAAFCRERERK